MKKSISRQARPANRNAAKPAKEKRVVLPGQRVDRATLAAIEARVSRYGSVSRVLDAALLALAGLESSMVSAGVLDAKGNWARQPGQKPARQSFTPREYLRMGGTGGMGGMTPR